MQNPPTDPANPELPVTVSLSINIINIDKINTAQMMFALTMMVSLEWADHRLKFNNLKKGLGINSLHLGSFIVVFLAEIWPNSELRINFE